MIDQQGFIGGTVTTAPGSFRRHLEHRERTNTYTLARRATPRYAKFNPVTDASNVDRDCWKNRSSTALHSTCTAPSGQRSASRIGFDLRLAVLVLRRTRSRQQPWTSTRLADRSSPAGSIRGFPVYTNRWLPAYRPLSSQANTAFMIFGNMKACAFGDKGDMRVGTVRVRQLRRQRSRSFRPARHRLQAPPRIRGRAP